MSELILAHGDDTIEFQNLDECASTIEIRRKQGVFITFGTNQGVRPKDGNTARLGIVLWLDRDKVAEAFAAEKAAAEPAAEQED